MLFCYIKTFLFWFKPISFCTSAWGNFPTNPVWLQDFFIFALIQKHICIVSSGYFHVICISRIMTASVAFLPCQYSCQWSLPAALQHYSLYINEGLRWNACTLFYMAHICVCMHSVSLIYVYASLPWSIYISHHVWPTRVTLHFHSSVFLLYIHMMDGQQS